MTAISPRVLTDASIAVGRMNMNARIELADEVFMQQPNLLASVLVQQRNSEALVAASFLEWIEAHHTHSLDGGLEHAVQAS